MQVARWFIACNINGNSTLHKDIDELQCDDDPSWRVVEYFSEESSRLIDGIFALVDGLGSDGLQVYDFVHEVFEAGRKYKR